MISELEVGTMTGYLIHIDGALTREFDAVDPTVDKRLLSRFESLGGDGAAVGLISGRSERWLHQHLFPLLGEDSTLLVLGEYGDFRFSRGERSWDPDAEHFASRYRDLLKERIAAVARAHGVLVRKDDRDYEPKSGELWFGPGTGVLAVRTNPNSGAFGTKVDADLVYKIVRHAISDLGLPYDFDVKKTPVSTVISRKGVNLERAARLAVSMLDPAEDLEKWYAFGRSMDESMAYDEKIEFVSVDPKASKGTWDFLSKLA